MELTTRTEPETLWIIGAKGKEAVSGGLLFRQRHVSRRRRNFQNDIHCRFTFPDGKTEQHRFRAGETLYMKDYPTTGPPNADTVALERLDASTIRSTLKKGDQVVMTLTSVISKDGTTRTSTFKGKNAEGQDINNVVVYDKQ